MGILWDLFNNSSDDSKAKDENNKDLEDWQQDLVNKGEYNPDNFEEDDSDDEDDYYHEDDK